MQKSPNFKDKIDAPVWRDLMRLAAELDGFPKYLGQHPGGMILSSTPLIDIVPVQRGAIEGRYVCQWDKDSIDDAGFVKIDFLALGALSQLQEAIELIKSRTGKRIDLSRIDFEDAAVYDMLCRGDTIGIFQVESAAQMQTITRLRPRNLLDMAHEVGAVQAGRGRQSRRAGVPGPAQRQKAGNLRPSPGETGPGAHPGRGLIPGPGQPAGDRCRRLCPQRGRPAAPRLRHGSIMRSSSSSTGRSSSKERKAGASAEEAAEKVFKKFNGLYMFPESHAFAFGVTAYQASWLKYYYPLEFFVAIFNQQPMGFYNLETLKEDAKRHGITVLNPDINKSQAKCTIEIITYPPDPLPLQGKGVNERELAPLSPLRESGEVRT